MTKEDKEKALSFINQIPVENLKEYIKSNSISFDEMRSAGLMRAKQDELQDFLEGIREEQGNEQRIWDNAQKENKIRSYEEYLMVYPEGIYAPIARSRIKVLKEEQIGEKERILEDIRLEPEKYTPEYIQDLMDDGLFTKRDLIDRDIITARALELYFNPPWILDGTDQESWNQLPKLPKNKTDIYIFGIPASGKSCVLAGLFYKANQAGILSPDIENKKGLDYMNNLIKSVKMGYVPPATNTNSVNYISCSLMDKDSSGKEREYPISLVEMSGEFFNSTYESGSASNDNSIGASGYLNNDNKKIIYFVVDYKKHTDGIDFNEIAEQSAILMFVLKLLEKDKTLENTISIQILVTKSDLMPDGDKLEYTRRFLTTYYLNVVNEIKRLNRIYNINKARDYKVVYHPFSLGRFMLGKTYEYKGEDSQNLLKALINLTPHKRKESWWSKL